MNNVIIIGAGLSGLSTAYHLEKLGFRNYTIIEKENTVGGLCRSTQQGNFVFDYSGHLLHSNNTYFSTLLKEFLGENIHKITRNSCIYSHNVYTPYPYQTNLHGLPSNIVADCIEGFAQKSTNNLEDKTFYNWVLKYFGNGFAQNFFFPYQEKLLLCDLKKLAASWTGRFVPKTTLREVIKGALESPKDKIGYNASFMYPKKGGIQSFAKKFASLIPGNIHTNKTVRSINLSKRQLKLNTGETLHFNVLVNTMPLNTMLSILQDRPDTSFSNCASSLEATGILCINLGLACDVSSKRHWIYFPEKHIPFYRCGFYNNFSSHNTLQGESSLYIECSYNQQSAKNKKELVSSTISTAKNILGIKDKDIIEKHVIDMPHAYVIYNFWRENNLEKLLTQLSHEQIYSIGRYGAWNYSSMQEAVLDGKTTAELIVHMEEFGCRHYNKKTNPYTKTRTT